MDVWESIIAKEVGANPSIKEPSARRSSGRGAGSHCRPWRDSTSDQRPDGENALLPAPSVDRLFDRRLIGFEDSGERRVINVGGFTEGQRAYLVFHRNAVQLKAMG